MEPQFVTIGGTLAGDAGSERWCLNKPWFCETAPCSHKLTCTWGAQKHQCETENYRNLLIFILLRRLSLLRMIFAFHISPRFPFIEISVTEMSSRIIVI